MRTQLVTWRSSLCAALGLAALACGGQTDADQESVSGGAGGTSGGAGGTSNTSSCVNPRPVIGIDGRETGFVTCEAGFIHRPEVRECPSIVPRPDPVAPPQLDPPSACTRDQDCAHMIHGHCVAGQGYRASSVYGYCVTGCVRDQDCESGMVCVCGNPVGQCQSATCTTDADCGAGRLCTSAETLSCDGAPYLGEFACQMPGDACRGRADCTPAAENCVPGSSGRVCQGRPICGRPFLIDGEPRQASIVEYPAGWIAQVAPSVAALSPVSRAALADHWTHNGLMEHASVAAFARFTLELLALGAPASLVRAAQQALADEIAHAELCFGLVRVYAGRTIQPGPLTIQGALDRQSYADIVHRAIAEACIGETLAAVEAAEAREHASDPEVRAVLGRIAADEARHAELGFRFLRWVLATGTPAAREQLCRLASDLAEQELERSFEGPDDPSPELLAHGVLTGAQRREVRRAAVVELILPVVRALAHAPERTAEAGVDRHAAA
jgi:hypothetical protein